MTETGKIKLTDPQRKVLANALELKHFGTGGEIDSGGFSHLQFLYDGKQSAAGVRVCQRLRELGLLEVELANGTGCIARLTQAGEQIAEGLEEATETAAKIKAAREAEGIAKAQHINRIGQTGLPHDDFDVDNKIFLVVVSIEHRATFAVAASNSDEAQRKLNMGRGGSDAVQLGKTVEHGRSVCVVPTESDLTSAKPSEIRTVSEGRYAAADRLAREVKGY